MPRFAASGATNGSTEALRCKNRAIYAENAGATPIILSNHLKITVSLAVPEAKAGMPRTCFGARSSFSAGNWNRINETQIFNPLLYQLNYPAVEKGAK